MSQATDLLDSLTEDEIAAYTADSDTEAHIVIGADRKIIVPDVLKRIAVQYDHNIETVTFDCVRYWDEHDMSQMIVYINYRLSDGTLDCYPADNVTADGDIMHFTWTISSNVTSAVGNIAFLVCVKKTNSEGYEENHWNSELCTDLYVSEGLECSSIPFEQYPDIVNQLLARMNSVEEVRPIAEEAAASAANSAEAARQSVNNISTLTSVVVQHSNDAQASKEAAAVSALEASTAAASQVGTKADAIVLSREGDSIILTDSSDDPLRGLRVMGKTEQMTTTGKNQVDMSEFEFDDSNYTHMLYASSSVSANAFYDFLRAYTGESIIVSMERTGTASGIDIGSLRFYGEGNVLICAIVPYVAHTIVELPETFTAAYIYGSTTGASVKNIQVEFGTEVTDYEPYTGGVASPNPDWPQDLTSIENPTITVNGKNFFDMSKIETRDNVTKLADGTISVSHYYSPTNVRLRELAPGMIAGKSYTLELDTDGNQFIYLNSYAKIWNHGTSMLVTDAILDSPVTLYGKTEQVDGSTIIRSIQFRLSETSDGYEEYREAGIMTTARTLRGIPVAANGNYTDSNGQQWICDEIDFERGVYIQRVGEIIVDNSMTYFYNTDNHFLHTGSDIFDNVAAWETRILSTHFVAVGNGIDMYDYGWFQFNSNGGIRFRIEGVDTVEALISWLDANEVSAIYPYVTPIETALTAEELSAYKALHTNYPNTVVLNDVDARMFLDYNADTKMYIDNGLNSGISSALEAIMNDSY